MLIRRSLGAQEEVSLREPAFLGWSRTWTEFRRYFYNSKIIHDDFLLYNLLSPNEKLCFLEYCLNYINNFEWKRGRCRLPQNPNKTRSQIFISSWFKINFWSVNQKISHSDSTAVIISPLRADWPSDVEAFWSMLWRWLESASRSLCFSF